MCSVWDEVTATGRSSGPQGTVGVWPCSVGAQSSPSEDWGVWPPSSWKLQGWLSPGAAGGGPAAARVGWA